MISTKAKLSSKEKEEIMDILNTELALIGGTLVVMGFCVMLLGGLIWFASRT